MIESRIGIILILINRSIVVRVSYKKRGRGRRNEVEEIRKKKEEIREKILNALYHDIQQKTSNVMSPE